MPDLVHFAGATIVEPASATSPSAPTSRSRLPITAIVEIKTKKLETSDAGALCSRRHRRRCNNALRHAQVTGTNKPTLRPLPSARRHHPHRVIRHLRLFVIVVGRRRPAPGSWRGGPGDPQSLGGPEGMDLEKKRALDRGIAWCRKLWATTWHAAAARALYANARCSGWPRIPTLSAQSVMGEAASHRADRRPGSSRQDRAMGPSAWPTARKKKNRLGAS